MLRIRCPWCGVRDEVEFRYRGDAHAARPACDTSGSSRGAGQLETFGAYVYERDNPCGWHVEWWLHVAGCRRLLKVVRHTVTHEIAWIGGPQDTPEMPADATGPG
jgi:sarcosine oxidase subunit delta